jgi:hypothetical protein
MTERWAARPCHDTLHERWRWDLARWWDEQNDETRVAMEVIQAGMEWVSNSRLFPSERASGIADKASSSCEEPGHEMDIDEAQDTAARVGYSVVAVATKEADQVEQPPCIGQELPADKQR